MAACRDAGEMLGMKGEEEEQLLATASNAFCRALDREDEYDATDALASQSLRPDLAMDRPPLETEVRRLSPMCCLSRPVLDPVVRCSTLYCGVWCGTSLQLEPGHVKQLPDLQGAKLQQPLQ